MKMNELPFVSIIIPCRNEKRFISKCLDSIIAQDYPKDKLEILIVDGMSDDGTRQVVNSYAKNYPFVRVLDNPRRITPCAFNIGIRDSKGDAIILMGSHSTYKSDYISKCIKYLFEYSADNVGGAMVTLPRNDTIFGKAIAIALSHRFGVGGSTFRTGCKEPKWVDTVFGGCYRRGVFEKIGLFNEKLASSQDMEFNQRLRKAGGKILLVPEIVSYYYARSDMASFCRNNFRNGFWAVYPLKFVKLHFSLRHYVPLIFVASLIVTGISGIFVPFFGWLFFLITTLYLLTVFYFSVKIAERERNLWYLFVMPVIFANLHIGYGLGSICGAIKLLLPAKEASN